MKRYSLLVAGLLSIAAVTACQKKEVPKPTEPPKPSMESSAQNPAAGQQGAPATPPAAGSSAAPSTQPIAPAPKK